MASRVSVSAAPVVAKSQRPAHHSNDSASLFNNPWKSFIDPVGIVSGLKLLLLEYREPPVPKDIATLIPVHKPTWVNSASNIGDIKATWLGHASFLLELPAPEGCARGLRVITDPVFSDRCSPFSFVGPKRYTKAPCQVEDLPDIDLILISHNHYDHLDSATLSKLQKAQSPHIMVPLGNRPILNSLGFSNEKIHDLDWWDMRSVTARLPLAGGQGDVETSFDVTCVPAQHMTNRGAFDRMKTLWGGFVLTSPQTPATKPGSETKASPPFKVYFSGDTAYRHVPRGAEEDKQPHCPVFKEIGEKFGSFDLALLPIGAYEPRHFMSSMHCSPSDAVCIYKDINARRAIGMHWGTWILTTEDVMDPPKRLIEECAKARIEAGSFGISDLGETIVVAPQA